MIRTGWEGNCVAVWLYLIQFFKTSASAGAGRSCVLVELFVIFRYQYQFWWVLTHVTVLSGCCVWSERCRTDIHEDKLTSTKDLCVCFWQSWWLYLLFEWAQFVHSNPSCVVPSPLFLMSLTARTDRSLSDVSGFFRLWQNCKPVQRETFFALAWSNCALILSLMCKNMQSLQHATHKIADIPVFDLVAGKLQCFISASKHDIAECWDSPTAQVRFMMLTLLHPELLCDSVLDYLQCLTALRIVVASLVCTRSPPAHTYPPWPYRQLKLSLLSKQSPALKSRQSRNRVSHFCACRAISIKIQE